MKVLTSDQMRKIDELTIASGIPGLVLMENAACRVVEAMERRFAPLNGQRIVILCGKGNNGGDGLAIARQLLTRFRPAALDVVLFASPEQLRGDAAANLAMWEAAGGSICPVIPERAHSATLLVDAVLGTGTRGAASGEALTAIRAINGAFPLARVVAVDLPSGMDSDSGSSPGEHARADLTVTFTAPKRAHALAPNCDRMGEIVVSPIGTRPEFFEDPQAFWLSLLEPAMFASLLRPRASDSHKGSFGHVLVLGGASGKTGAAILTGQAALRAGAGLVTVACQEPLAVNASVPELMTAPLPPAAQIPNVTAGKTVVAIGPGLGTEAAEAELARELCARCELPVVADADALNALAGAPPATPPALRVLTPHPGEMGRLTGSGGAIPNEARLETARDYATARGVVLVLKGQRTLIAFPDGRVWINPAGTPAMATAGSGDVLTGLIAGLLAQFPRQADEAIAAACYLHGKAGELAASELGEQAVIAGDLTRFLPAAVKLCAQQTHAV